MSTSCRKVEENLIDLVENKVPESLRNEIIGHLDDCPRCQHLVEHFDRIWADFSPRPKTRPSPSFWPGLLEKIQRNEPHRRPMNRLLWGLKSSLRPIAAALILLSGISFGYYLGNTPPVPETSSEITDMDTTAVVEIFIDPYLLDFQDFPLGSVADFYLSPGIQQQDKKP